MNRLFEELKYCGFNFLILIFGYFYFYNPASELRDRFHQKYGAGIKSSNILNTEYREDGKEHVHIYLWAIVVFALVIAIAVILMFAVEVFISAILQIIIATLLIVFSLFGMINAYIATIFVGMIVLALMGLAVFGGINNR
ncbi:TPA: hypothetical protein ACK0JT_002121 [Staphylococcus aureus]